MPWPPPLPPTMILAHHPISIGAVLARTHPEPSLSLARAPTFSIDSIVQTAHQPWVKVAVGHTLARDGWVGMLPHQFQHRVRFQTIPSRIHTLRWTASCDDYRVLLDPAVQRFINTSVPWFDLTIVANHTKPTAALFSSLRGFATLKSVTFVGTQESTRYPSWAPFAALRLPHGLLTLYFKVEVGLSPDLKRIAIPPTVIELWLNSHITRPSDLPALPQGLNNLTIRNAGFRDVSPFYPLFPPHLLWLDIQRPQSLAVGASCKVMAKLDEALLFHLVCPLDKLPGITTHFRGLDSRFPPDHPRLSEGWEWVAPGVEAQHHNRADMEFWTVTLGTKILKVTDCAEVPSRLQVLGLLASLDITRTPLNLLPSYLPGKHYLRTVSFTECTFPPHLDLLVVEIQEALFHQCGAAVLRTGLHKCRSLHLLDLANNPVDTRHWDSRCLPPCLELLRVALVSSRGVRAVDLGTLTQVTNLEVVCADASLAKVVFPPNLKTLKVVCPENPPAHPPCRHKLFTAVAQWWYIHLPFLKPSSDSTEFPWAALPASLEQLTVNNIPLAPPACPLPLTLLTLTNCSITKIPPWLFPSLVSLDLSHNPLTTPLTPHTFSQALSSLTLLGCPPINTSSIRFCRDFVLVRWPASTKSTPVSRIVAA